MSPLRIVLAVAFAVIAGPALAQASPLEDLFRRGPEAPPADVPAASTFPNLAGCENSLAGLAFGPQTAVVAQLERRIGWWEGATIATVPAFVALAQAKVALDCFQRRLVLLAAFIPVATDAARATAEVQSRFGGRAGELLAGEVPPGADPAAWWAEADQAFGLLAHAERDLINAVLNGVRDRNATLAAGTSALAEFARMVADIDRAPPQEPGETFQWGSSLAWRALLVGIELDRVQLEDLRRQPDAAYAHLTATAPSSPLGTVAPELAELMLHTAALRATRGNLVPGAPRNWSTEANRTRLAEELYMLHAIEADLATWIGAAFEERAEIKREQLQMQHAANVFGGMPERQSRLVRDVEWEGFLEDEARERDRTIERWRTFLASQRERAIAAAIVLAAQR